MNRNKKIVASAAIVIAIVSVIISINQTNTTLRNLFCAPCIEGSKNNLEGSKIIQVTGALGPESIAFDPNGDGPYTGVADGRILKWQGDELGWTEFAVTTSQRKECVRPFAPDIEHICGRPLGIRFDKKTGDLYIADAYLGFQVVGPEGGLATQLVTEAAGQPLRFTNDLDIDEHKGVIYFTDSSTGFQRRQFMSSILSGDKTGRLLKYEKTTKEVTILLQGLAFANGDVFAELPGFPDNVRINSNGEFWVALHAKKGLFGKLILLNSWLGKTLLKLPLSFRQLHSLLVGGKPHATAIKLSEKGEVLEVLEDCEGKTLSFISEVEEKDGQLWMGSVLMPFIGIYNRFRN
ncbi:protein STRICTOSIDINE SYNTHASE-LIKE 10 [Citrus sinensis]|nr:protein STRICTOSIDINE SYNTHASE-LIKE 10 [Citrus sinensis]